MVFKKMLGYNYNVIKDILKLNDKIIDPLANTKRKILAQTAGVFDPLSLCLPLMVRGKLLLRDQWKMKLGWDDVIPTDKVKDWRNSAPKLTTLNEFEFPRYVFRDDFPSDVFVFCNASKSGNGCAIYLVQNGKLSLLFAKSKVSLMTQKSLSTVELLALYLVLKCLKSLFEIICCLKIKNIFIAVDAQVMLA